MVSTGSRECTRTDNSVGNLLSVSTKSDVLRGRVTGKSCRCALMYSMFADYVLEFTVNLVPDNDGMNDCIAVAASFSYGVSHTASYRGFKLTNHNLSRSLTSSMLI